MKEENNNYAINRIQDKIKRFIPMFDDIRMSSDHEIGRLFDDNCKTFPGNEKVQFERIREFDITQTKIVLKDLMSSRKNPQAYLYDCREGIAIIDSDCWNNDCMILALMTRIYIEQYRAASSVYMVNEYYKILCHIVGREVDDLQEILDYHATSHCASILNYKYEKLYLLKTFDLDIQMGYPLGTVYGMGDNKYIDYLLDKIA